MRFSGSLLLLATLIAAPSEAARSWRIDLESGTAVMDEISPLVFRVTNTSTAGERLGGILFQLVQKDYDIDGGTAPAGWSVNAIDKQLRQVAFTAEGQCGGGLAPGEHALFELRVIGQPATADLRGDVLDVKKTEAFDACAPRDFGDPSPSASWSRVGLHASVTATPRSLGVGDTVTVSLNVINNSTGFQSAIVPAAPQPVGDATFFLTSGPTPDQASLASRASATFTWTFTALTNGSAVFRTSAANGRVSSPEVDSLQVNVGSFPADTDVLPEEVVSGQNVEVVLTVSNNSPDPAQNVTAQPPTVGGTAAATLISGPSPAAVAWLPGGGSTSFRWTYQVSGPVGATYQFTARATATRGGNPIDSDPVTSAQGRVVSSSVTASPAAIASGATNRAIAYTVFNGGTVAIDQVSLVEPDKSVFIVSGSPYSADTSGWNTSNNSYTWTAPNAAAQIAPGQTKTFTLMYARIATLSANATFSHKFNLRPTNGLPLRVETQVTVFVSRTIPEVASLTAVSGDGRNTLMWNNPADHDGVLILRSANAPPDTAPTPGTVYSPGQTVGNATVVYSDTRSFASSHVDSTVANGTPYYYRVFNHDPYFIYSAGVVPGDQGLFSVPTSRGAGEPWWCYSVGFPSTQQPVSDANGKSVLTSSNLGAITSNVVDGADPSQDGAERFRPMPLRAAIQNRLLVTSVAGHGQSIITGDRSGRAYLLSSSDGRVIWTGNGGAPLGESIQAQPMVQFSAYSAEPFKTTHAGRDLLYFATRNDSSTTSNGVFALSSVDGSVVWQYAPGDLDMMNGVMAVDYATNRLWVGARGTGSVRVLSTIDGTEVTRFELGDVDFGVIPDLFTRQAYVVNTGGRVHGIDLDTLEVKWTQDVGATSGYVWSMGSKPVTTTDTTTDPPTTTTSYRGGFIASLKSGAVEYWKVNWVDTAAPTITRAWSVAAPNPSAVYVTGNKAYFGDANGVLHRVDATTGADEAQLALSATGLGMPSYDRVAARLNVGAVDGRICSVPLSF